MSRIDALRKLLVDATPGPWRWGGGNVIHTPQPIEVTEANWGGKGLTSYRLAAVQDEGAWRDEDAALIAAAPEALALLLDVAEAASLLEPNRDLRCRMPRRVPLRKGIFRNEDCRECVPCFLRAALARWEAPDG